MRPYRSFQLPTLWLVISALTLPAVTFSNTNARVLKRGESAQATQVDVSSARTLRVYEDGRQELDGVPLRTDIACHARLDNGAAWAIDQWITGNELYKSYQDPTAACGGSYPYTVHEVHMFLQIGMAATITVAADIELVDNDFLPGCPVPGELVYLSNLVDMTFPGPGLYDVVVNLDTPVVVNGPFFTGFFFGSLVSPTWSLQIITDSLEKTCVSYNIWDTTLGYIDLGDDEAVHQAVYPPTDPCYSTVGNSPDCFDFDGRLILFTAGILKDKTNCCALPGDSNNDARINIQDITTILEFIFNGNIGGIACRDQADATGDNTVNIQDVTTLVTFIFSGGAPPTCGTTGS